MLSNFNRVIRIALFLIFSWSSGFSLQVIELDYQKNLDAAEKYMNAGEYQEAINQYQVAYLLALQNLDVDNSEALQIKHRLENAMRKKHLDAATKLMATGEYQEAIGQYNAAYLAVSQYSDENDPKVLEIKRGLENARKKIWEKKSNEPVYQKRLDTATQHMAKKEYQEAIEQYNAVYLVALQNFGENDPKVFAIKDSLGKAYSLFAIKKNEEMLIKLDYQKRLDTATQHMAKKEYQEAIEQYNTANLVASQNFGENDSNVLKIKDGLNNAHVLMRKKHEEKEDNELAYQNYLEEGKQYMAVNNYKKAYEHYMQVLAFVTKKFGIKDSKFLEAQSYAVKATSLLLKETFIATHKKEFLERHQIAVDSMSFQETMARAAVAAQKDFLETPQEKDKDTTSMGNSTPETSSGEIVRSKKPDRVKMYLEKLRKIVNLSDEQAQALEKNLRNTLRAGGQDAEQLYMGLDMLTVDSAGLNKAYSASHMGKLIKKQTQNWLKTSSESHRALQNKIKERVSKLDLLIYPNVLDTAALNLENKFYTNKAKELIQKGVSQIDPEVLNGLPDTSRDNLLTKLQIEADARLAYISKAVALHPELANQAYNQAIRLKGRYLVFQKHGFLRSIVNQKKDTKLWSLYQDLLELENQLTQLLVSNSEIYYKNYEQYLQLQKEISEKEIELSQSLERQLPESSIHSWQDVLKKLKKGEAAIEIVRFLDREDGDWSDKIRYAALIISPDLQRPVFVSLPNGNEMESSGYAQYIDLIGGSSNQIHDNTLHPYDIYWSPIQKYLKGIKTVYFSPDGIYHKINLNLLKVSETPKTFLIDELEFVPVNSTASSFQEATFHLETSTAVLVGNPNYDLGKSNNPERNAASAKDSLFIEPPFKNKSWESLQASDVEVNHIETLLKNQNVQVLVFKKDSASETNLKKLESPGILHIATHAASPVVDWGRILPIPVSALDTLNMPGGYPLLQFLIGNPFDPNQKNPYTDIIEAFQAEDATMPQRVKAMEQYGNAILVNRRWTDPEITSGIVLAGAHATHSAPFEQSMEDGILYSRELKFLNLMKTQLVVLSVCNSGSGFLTAHGTVSLKRAAQFAGAKFIISSLSHVDDEITQEFMTVFYTMLFADQTKKTMSEIFRSAQLEIRDSNDYAPYQWGAFTLTVN